MKPFIPLLAIALTLAGCGPQKNLALSSLESTPQNEGYADIRPSSDTYSVQHVKMEDTEKATYQSFQDYLRAHVSGIIISSSGGIIIRGINSINSSTDPLVLVDGMEVSDLSSINPNDIHSVDVIKDGGAASYGMRGANGVILVTTESAYLTKQAEREAKKHEKEAARAAKKAAKKK